MSLYIGLYVFFQCAELPFPAFLSWVNLCVNWGFLLWSGYQAGKIILDCVLSNAKNQMTSEHMWSGIMLALLHVLPTALMALFMLRQGFAGK